MKTTLTMEAKSLVTGNPIIREIEVTLVENAAGRVYLEGFRPYIEVSDLCGSETKIKEKTLHVQADIQKPVLYGKVTPKGKSKSVPLEFATENRPLHRELYDCAVAIMDAVADARQSISDEESAMKKAAATAGFPADSVRIRFLRSEADGWVEIWADAEDRQLRSPNLGGRNGSWGWMTVEDHAAAITPKPEPAKPSKPVVNLLTIEVPADALAAYKRYRGDADAAWDDEDETACMSIRAYGAAIEAQGLAYPKMAPIRSDEMSTHEG